jgi:hypothetical protein
MAKGLKILVSNVRENCLIMARGITRGLSAGSTPEARLARNRYFILLKVLLKVATFCLKLH